jgi:hypothetical protein
MSDDSATASVQIDADAQNGKMFYKSKELWTAFVSLIAFGIQMKYGFILPPEIQASMVIVLLGIFRTTSTSEPIAWTKRQLQSMNP